MVMMSDLPEPVQACCNNRVPLGRIPARVKAVLTLPGTCFFGTDWHFLPVWNVGINDFIIVRLNLLQHTLRRTDRCCKLMRSMLHIHAVLACRQGKMASVGQVFLARGTGQSGGGGFPGLGAHAGLLANAGVAGTVTVATCVSMAETSMASSPSLTIAPAGEYGFAEAGR